MIQFYIYIVFAFLVALYLVRKHRPKYSIVTFLLCFWIFIDDVGNKTEFKLSLPGFDLQPMRILFLFCLGFLISKPFVDRYRSSKKFSLISVKPNYETYLSVFIIIAGLSNVVNFNLLGPVDFYIELSIFLRFYVVYFTVRTIADEAVLKTVKDTLIVVCVVSCIVAFLQLADQSFFRVYELYARSAFGGLIRSTGVFRDDYIHSYVVFVGLVWVYFTEPAGIKRSALIGLFLAGIFVAFMRMGYVVTALMLWHAFYFKTRSSNQLKILITSASMMALVAVGFWTLTSGVLDSSVAQDRMLDEGTMELRFKLYGKAIEEVTKSTKGFFFGYGNKDNPQYADAIYDVTRSELWASGEKGGWHNLFISLLYFNGFPTMVAFVAFLITFTRYFYTLEKRTGNYFYLIPFYCAIGYIVANLTLALSISSIFGILMGISAAIAVWIREKEVNQLANDES